MCSTPHSKVESCTSRAVRGSPPSPRAHPLRRARRVRAPAQRGPGSLPAFRHGPAGTWDRGLGRWRAVDRTAGPEEPTVLTGGDGSNVALNELVQGQTNSDGLRSRVPFLPLTERIHSRRRRTTPRTPRHPCTGGKNSAVRTRPSHPRPGGEDASSSSRVTASCETPPRRRGGRRATGVTATNTGSPPHRRGGQTLGMLAIAGMRDTPRVGRGGLQSGKRITLDERNTPASAGRTRVGRPGAAGEPEHPRVGGEDGRVVGVEPAVGGTPPRRRGGRRRRRGRRVWRRNTPASAGRSPGASATADSTPEHPRVGGEVPMSIGPAKEQTGTPPRRRGGPWSHASVADRERNTPASAGRSRPSSRRRARWPEHPRVGGEVGGRAADAEEPRGTPPRRRGGRNGGRRRAATARNTPASAGRSSRRRGAGWCAPEHPRVGGEVMIQATAAPASTGTPPRRRGGPFLTCALRGGLRFLYLGCGGHAD